MKYPDLRKHRGAYAIPMTPFADDDRIDEGVLAKEIEFCLENGADGLCSPVMVSEFEHLSEAERKLMIRVPLEVNAGRVPFIANVAAPSTEVAVDLADYAQQCGADMVIAMQPYVVPLEFPQVVRYYQRISSAVDLPIMLQNAPFGVTPLSLEQIETLFQEVENITWVKQELNPQVVAIADLIDRRIPGLQGTMSGLGGLYLPYDFKLGASGTIHACQFCDVVSAIWRLYEEGEEMKGQRLFNKFLRGVILELRHGFAFDKEIMVRRGIFKSHRVRSSASPLPPSAMEEIDDFWKYYNDVILPEL
ncbi:MAG: dihydrodipicolinate synthase family protein [Verrucomicrobiota bacterium]